MTFKCLVLPAILVTAGVAFYAAQPPKLKLVDYGPIYGTRDVYYGPSAEEFCRLKGEPGSIIDPADDPELKPYLSK